MVIAGRTHIPVITQEQCNHCQLCRWLCPDLAITFQNGDGKLEIDYNYCKGCGICSSVCPKEALVMVLEE